MAENETRELESIIHKCPAKCMELIGGSKYTSFSNEGIVNVRMRERKGPKMIPRFLSK